MEAKKNGIDETICRAATETQTGRTDLCTKLGKEKEGWTDRVTVKHTHSVQFSHSVVSDSLWPHGLQHARPPCPSQPQSFHKLMSIELMMSSNHIILCRPLHLLPSVFPSIRVFSNESVLRIRWLKYWSFSFSISPSNEYSGLISFRMDWLDLLAVQGTQESSPTPQLESTQPSLQSNSHIHT